MTPPSPKENKFVGGEEEAEALVRSMELEEPEESVDEAAEGEEESL